MEQLTDQNLARLFCEVSTVAVLGASAKRERPAFYVPAYMVEKGFRVLPVNPACAGTALLGEAVRERLTDIREPVDVVNVFRRAEALQAHEGEILAMEPLPRIVWLQLGIRSTDFTRRMNEAGIQVIEDCCIMAEHKRLFDTP